MPTLQGRTLFITGASRGIGRAIALRCAREGANIAVTAKTVTPHPRLPGTIHEVAREVEAAGGKALAIQLDVRDDAAIAAAVQQAATHFGGIDILVNNASAIQLTGTLATPARRFDLMFGVNVRGTFLCSQACIPFLARGINPHILNLAPPLSVKPQWFQGHVAYTMAKYGMSMCTLAWLKIPRARHRRELAVAAHDHLDCRHRGEFSRGNPQGEPQTGYHGRCGARDSQARQPHRNRQFLHR